MSAIPTPGDVDSYVAGVRRALATSCTVQEVTLAGRPVIVGSRKDFRLRWLATQLATTVTVASFDSEVDLATLDSYLGAAGREAQLVTGGLAGLQRGSAAVAIAVLPELTAVASDWATLPHGHAFASVGYPVAVGLRDRRVLEPVRMRLGRMFQSFLHELVQQVAAEPLGQLPDT
ncbi:MAG: hypothetical protein QOG99_630 [Frankiales bacterium]|jgi:hypothetical protein|nr:hypothetical protein [Frankiales bacterium]